MNRTLDRMIARLAEGGSLFGRGSAYADMHAICCELDARRLTALDERNAANERVARLEEVLRYVLDELNDVDLVGAWYLSLSKAADCARAVLDAKPAEPGR